MFILMKLLQVDILDAIELVLFKCLIYQSQVLLHYPLLLSLQIFEDEFSNLLLSVLS